MSTIIITIATIMADTAIISEILVNGLDHLFLFNFKMELNNEPTRLIATKKTKLAKAFVEK